MQRLCHAVYATAVLLLFVAALAVMAACTSGKSSAPPQALPAVSPLPSLKPAAWIKQINPTGQAGTLAQIRIIFADPLVPLQAIETPSEQATLQYFVIDPTIPGRFRFLTPRMVGFEEDEALPIATRVRITVKAGLRDLAGHRLASDLAWTFTTVPLRFSNLPGPNPDNQGDATPSPLKPTWRIHANAELNLESFRAHTSLIQTGTKQTVALAIEQAQLASPPPGDEDQPQNQYDASTRPWVYSVTPAAPLAKGADYELRIGQGVLPARGNLPSAQAFSGYISTFKPLAFTRLSNQDTGRFAAGQAQLEFNNPLSAESARKNLSMAPQPQSTAGLWQVNDNDTVVGINQAWLTPTTRYTITIGSGLTDSFGQTLGKPRTVIYDTGNLAPDFWAPDGVNIFPADNNLRLDISAVNVPNNRYAAAYRVLAPEDLVYADSAYPDSSGPRILPNESGWASSTIAAKQNQVVTITVPVREKLGGKSGMLAYGLEAATHRVTDEPIQRYFGLLQLTNLGVFAQWFPASGVIRAQHLSDGSAAAGATVDVFVSRVGQAAGGTPVPCASGATDASGTFWLQADAMRRCSREATAGQPPSLLAIVREDKDWAYVRTDDWSGAYGYDIYAGWQAAAPQSRGTIFSDRQLYQPNETGSFTAVAYYLQGGTLVQDRRGRYRVRLEGPNGQKTDLGSHTTNDYGTFSFEVPFKANLALGFYSVIARSDNGVDLSGDFQLAEFKPPNFRVDLSLDKAVAFPNDVVTAKGTSTYLFGSALQGASAQYYVTREQAYFTPKGWEDFSFGRQWFWPENPPSVSSDVAQVKSKLDAAGTLAQNVTVANDLPYPMTYRVDLQVSDVSNLSVADSKTFTALPSPEIIGMQGDWVASAGKPASFKVIVTDSSGAPLRGRKVRVQLDAMQYSSAAQLMDSGETEHDQVRYSTVATTDVTSGDTPQTLTLTAPQAGPYRVRANFDSAGSEATATDLALWATGPGEVNWGGQARDHLQVKLAKATYRPGEMATALIQSPYARAELYFAVVRDRTLYHSISTVQGGAPQIRFRVTRDMTPNAAVEAVLVRRGPPLKQLQPGSLDSLARIGFAPFSLNLEDRYLQVAVTPLRASLAPGSRQTVRLRLSDQTGHPLRGQFAAMVVNEAILQLSGYRPPDLVKIVFAQQPIATRFADNRPAVVLAQIASPLQKGWGYGGGFMPGAAGTRIRRNFKPLAYFNGALESDANGDARFSFSVPDDLTTWRIMAVAIGATASASAADMRFGNGDATFITTKPLLTNPILPQFARPGDKLSAGLSVTTTNGAQGTLDILASLSGPLVFDTPGGNQQSQQATKAVGSGTQAFRFPMLATGAGTAELTFRSRLGNESDAFAFPLAIREPRNVMEQVVESGVTANQSSIPLNVDPRAVNDSGGLHVSLASTLLPEITVPAMKLLDNDDLAILEPLASRLLISADLKILSDRYARSLGAFDPGKFGAATLEQLRKLQTPEGGFVWYAGSRWGADVFVTPYAAQALAATRNAGLPIDQSSLQRLTTYLENSLRDPKVCENIADCRARVRLDILLALSELGETRNDFLSDIYDRRNNFDLLGQVELARYLLKFPSWRTQADQMAAQLEQSVYETGRYATINYPEEWGWLESPAVMRAQVLQLFIARHADSALLDRLVESLLALRRNGSWQNSYDTAAALSALIAYGKLQPQPPDFSATVTLAGQTLLATSFSGYQKTTSDVRVPMDRLPRNQSNLVLSKSGRGDLHYLAEYSYRLAGNLPGILNGLRVTRQIRPANDPKLIAKMGLNAPNDPLTLAPAQVFDIGLEIIADHPVDHVVISDQLP
ncbi:MAG TPA: alpha-2-macroglobulin family protein, partial [Candidatus Eremiobacteraceae bacterium]|nr:alpha-2-macroglobulin family protein [Candidatus Eremiobacteraceae bacterium]